MAGRRLGRAATLPAVLLLTAWALARIAADAIARTDLMDRYGHVAERFRRLALQMLDVPWQVPAVLAGVLALRLAWVQWQGHPPRRAVPEDAADDRIVVLPISMDVKLDCAKGQAFLFTPSGNARLWQPLNPRAGSYCLLFVQGETPFGLSLSAMYEVRGGTYPVPDFSPGALTVIRIDIVQTSGGFRYFATQSSPPPAEEAERGAGEPAAGGEPRFAASPA